jgi:glycosyltransferase involved in cell wall biosynthesis
VRIVQVVHWFLPQHLAGTEIYTYSLAQELSERHEVHIYCREDGFFDQELHETDELYDGLPVRRVYFNLLGRKANPLHQFFARIKNGVIERSFERLLGEITPDIVHVQHLLKLSAGLIPLTKKRGIPVVVTLADFWYICHNVLLLRPGQRRCRGPAWGLNCPGCAELEVSPPLRALLYPLMVPLFIYRNAYLKSCLRQADLVISPSAFVKKKLVENGYDGDRILVSGYGLRTFHPSAFRLHPSDRLRVGYIGTIQRHKGVHVLIEAFNQLTDSAAELQIYGNPGYAPEYYARVKDMARNPMIRFYGEVDNADIGKVLSELDVIVVPSIWYENSPITIYEAKAARVPVMASNIGGMAELVRDGVTGLLFEVGNADDLAAKMRLLIEDHCLLERLQANIGPVKSIEENARELEAIYQEVIAAQQGGVLSLSRGR